jgi:hypothetical protein
MTMLVSVFGLEESALAPLSALRPTPGPAF